MTKNLQKMKNEKDYISISHRRENGDEKKPRKKIDNQKKKRKKSKARRMRNKEQIKTFIKICTNKNKVDKKRAV